MIRLSCIRISRDSQQKCILQHVSSFVLRVLLMDMSCFSCMEDVIGMTCWRSIERSMRRAYIRIHREKHIYIVESRRSVLMYCFSVYLNCGLSIILACVLLDEVIEYQQLVVLELWYLEVEWPLPKWYYSSIHK